MNGAEIISGEVIEYLKNYFAPAAERVSKLPPAESSSEGTWLLLEDGEESTLHLMLGGKWLPAGAAGGLSSKVTFKSIGTGATEILNTVTLLHGVITDWQQT